MIRFAEIIWLVSTLAIATGNVPSATIRSAFIQITSDNEGENRRTYAPNYYQQIDDTYGSNRRMYAPDYYQPHSEKFGENRRSIDSTNGYYSNYQPYQPPRKPSYIILDGDAPSGGRDRPQMLGSTRAWHLQFNEGRHHQPQRTVSVTPQNTMPYQSVYSNLIQVLAEPTQRKYYGPYNGKGYFEKDRQPGFYETKVPNYDVIYPYESERNSIYFNDRLPDKFPSPFSPNVNFEIRDPPPLPGPRRDFGLYPTQTINYSEDTDLTRRPSSNELCNFIRVNENGFPVGKEMCGRSISDSILEENYPTDGQLILEHRKRYRGVYSGERTGRSEVSVNSNKLPKATRVLRRRRDLRNGKAEIKLIYKRAADNFFNRNRGYSSYYPTSDCCGHSYSSDYGGYGYNYGMRNNGEDSGYDTMRFISRPYYGYRESGSSNYDREGQRNDNEDYGEETTNNRGLTSYLTNGGRGDQNNRYKGTSSDDDDDGGDTKDEDESKSNRNKENDKKKNQGRSSSNNSRRNQFNSNRNSNDSNRDSGSRNQNSHRSGGRRSSDNNDRDSYENDNRGSNNGYNNDNNGPSYGYTNSDSSRNRNGGNNFRNYDYGNRGYRPYSSSRYGGGGGVNSGYGGYRNMGGGTYAGQMSSGYGFGY